MTIVRWNPILEMESLRHQMDEIFAEITGINSSKEGSRKPAIELIDNDDYLTLKAEIPGVEAKDLDINATREAVSIKGKYRRGRENADKGYFRSEFRYGKFERIIPLPVPINNNKAINNQQLEASVIRLFHSRFRQTGRLGDGGTRRLGITLTCHE